ncbi:MAG: hypothetical protein IPK60_22955 [Sandaracinaceae bacterium]|nr:hypothetical protein [Sandaracinaceae bacterium]
MKAKAKAKNGRPTSLTPELQARVVANVLRGAYIETACGAAGILRQSMYEWLRKGQAGVEPYAEFYEAVTAARDQAELSALNSITEAAQSDWRAAAWYLEKAHGKRYSGVNVSETKVEHIDRVAQAKAVQEAYGFASAPVDGDGAAGSVPAKLRH